MAEKRNCHGRYVICRNRVSGFVTRNKIIPLRLLTHYKCLYSNPLDCKSKKLEYEIIKKLIRMLQTATLYV